MRLSERLAMAATERADAAAAGTSVEDWRKRHAARSSREEPRGEQSPQTWSGLLAGPQPPEASPPEVAIILSPQTPVTAVDPDPNADPRSVCPTCGRIGELGMVDLHGRTADWACEACGTMWRVTLPSAPRFEQTDTLPPT